MERARAAWTDERLDDLSRRVDLGFDRVDRELRATRTELGARIDAQGAELGARIDALQRAMIQAAVAIVSANLVVTSTLVAALA